MKDNNTLREDWEKEWDKLTYDHEFDYVNDGKKFIRKLITKREQAVVENIKKIARLVKDPTTDTGAYVIRKIDFDYYEELKKAKG